MPQPPTVPRRLPSRNLAESIGSRSLYETREQLYLSWARARLGDHETGVTELASRRDGIPKDQETYLYVPFFQGLLAEIEAEGQETEGALALESTQRWRWRARRENAGPTLSCIASAAKLY